MLVLDTMLRRYDNECGWFYGISMSDNYLFTTQTPQKAVAFYDDKVKGLDANLVELEKIVQGKNSQLRVVEEGKFRVNRYFGVCLLTASSAQTENARRRGGRGWCECLNLYTTYEA